MFFKNKDKGVKELTVSPNPDYCIWVIPSDDLAYDAIANVDPGCQLLYVVNGQLRDKVRSRRVVINPKRERSENNHITLVGVNFDKIFEILCGVGRIPYKDYEIGAETVVGVSADMKVRIMDGWKLFSMLGNKNITADEINDLIRSKCAEILSAELSKKLQNCTYHTLTKEKNTMSKTLEESIAKVLDSLGVYLVDGTFALGEFFFQPDYVKLREDYGAHQTENMMEEDRLRLERRKNRMEMQMIESIARTNSQNAQADRSSQGNAVCCPECGIMVSPDVKFCPNCGKKIK